MTRVVVLLVPLFLSGCATSKADAVARDLTATKVAYGVSVNDLRALGGVRVQIDSGVFITRLDAVSVTVDLDRTDGRVDLAGLLDRLERQSPTAAGVLDGEASPSSAEVLARCRPVLVEPPTEEPYTCSLEVHTSKVRYTVKISRGRSTYTASFHGLPSQ